MSLGEVELEILSTPGHTWESISVLVREHSGAVPAAVLTGDSLFIGDVGRPDLVNLGDGSSADLARAMYRTVHEKLLTLPDEVVVMPAHGAGSSCGKNLSTELTSTIGEQRATNPSVQPMSEDDFVALVTEGQPAAPSYFSVDAAMNKRMHPLLAQDHTIPELSPERMKRNSPPARVSSMRAASTTSPPGICAVRSTSDSTGVSPRPAAWSPRWARRSY